MVALTQKFFQRIMHAFLVDGHIIMVIPYQTALNLLIFLQ